MHKLGIAALSVVACRSAGQTRPPPAVADVKIGIGNLDAMIATARADAYRKQLEHAAPPMSLSPADGNELELRAIEATVMIEGPLAHTELHVTFHNAEHRVREGRFAIALPADAAVGRFAMKNGSEWREARVVSRTRGREVYETYLHRGVDPALLEQDLGNQFSARVFPIAADADKELIIAYDHAVSASEPYVLALKGLPAIPKLAVTIDHDGATSKVAQTERAPDDVVVAIEDRAQAIAADGAFVARLDGIDAGPPAPLDRLLILVDTSASRATIMGRQAELVRRLVEHLDGDVAIAAFDHAVSELYRGPAPGAAGAVDALFDHGALGGSDLGVALAHARASGMARVLIVGDGAPTLGEWEPAKLAAIVAGGSIERIDAIQVGQGVDRDALRAIVAAGRRPGAILDGRDPARVAHQLAIALPPPRAIAVAGATTWPATTAGIAPGEPVWVFGRRNGGGPLAVTVGANAASLAPSRAQHVRVARAVARAQIAAVTDAMTNAPDKERPALAKQIEKLALEHQLVSSQTSLIVLETDADEQRMLGPRDDAPAPTQTTGPIIDQASTRSGITITHEYVRNIPTARTFSSSVAAAAGSQGDGVSFSGAASLENEYYVDGVKTSGGAELCMILGKAPSDPTRSVVARHSDDVPIPFEPHRQMWIDHHFAPSALGFEVPRYVPREERVEPPPAPPPIVEPPSPYIGQLADVMTALAANRNDRALELAARWQLANPGDVSAIVALGEALEARGAAAQAARAYASLVDLYPNRPEMLRAAGERLERLAARDPAARALAIDAYRRAIRERPDHVSTYRLLAYALVRDGRGVEALEALYAGRRRATRASIAQILVEDTAIVGAVAMTEHPELAATIAPRMPGAMPTTPSLRVVLAWETDANDVDLHITDATGGHAWYGARSLASGGSLRDDITTGYGPEMFEVDRPRAYPYRIGANYYRQGPMGILLGTVQVVQYDGAGHITVEDRPFAIQSNTATAELGVVERP